MRKGFTLVELLIAMGVMVSTFAVLAIITYSLTNESQRVLKRLNAVSEITSLNLWIVKNSQKAGPEPSKFLVVNATTIRYEVLVPFAQNGHITEQMTVEGSKILIQQKPFSPYDFLLSSKPTFTYSKVIPLDEKATVSFQSMTLGKLCYNLQAKGEKITVEYPASISLINIQ